MELDQQIQAAQSELQNAGCDAWELAALTSKGVNIGIRGQEVDKFQQSETSGLAVRVLKDQRPGFSYAIGGGGEAIALAVSEAMASAAAADPEPGFSLVPAAGELAPVEVFDQKLADDPVEAKVQRAKELAAAAMAADQRVVHVQPAEFSSVVSTLRLVNSLGLDFTHQGTLASAGALALAAQDGEQEMGWSSKSVRFLSELDPEALGQEAGRRAAAFLGARPVADGRYDVILENEVAIQFLDILAASLSGEALLKGRSLLADMEGKAVASPQVTIIDDGLYARGLGTSALDDEGTPQGKKDLVQDGVLQGFVYDRLWAARAGRQSTGNAQRASLKAPPGVGFSNLYIRPGQKSQEQLIASMGRGLVISEIMGGHTADPVSGEFSFGAAGFLVESGQKARPIKSIAIAGQVLSVFKSVAEVGGDLKFQGRQASPSLLVEAMSVSGP